jgi:1-acyl-sn-glycerol-3-phosphate acyltransferase
VQYQLSRLIAGPFLRGLARPKVTGAEHVPASGGAILASNHLSVVDSIYLPLMLQRPVTFAAKSEYFTSKRPGLRLMGLYLRATGQLSVDRAGARAAQDMLDDALALLRSGELFGIYPEGTRSPDGRLYRGRPGVGWLALKSGLPVIPVAMIGTDRVLPPGRVVPRPGRIEIRIGKPMSFGGEPGAEPGAGGGAEAGGGAGAGGGREAPGKARRAIADEVVRAIQELSGQEYVPMYASVRKEQLAAESGGPGRPGAANAG